VVRHHESENSVSEELETLVRRQAAVLVRVGPVSEGQHEKLGVQINTERLKQQGPIWCRTP